MTPFLGNLRRPAVADRGHSVSRASRGFVAGVAGAGLVLLTADARCHGAFARLDERVAARVPGLRRPRLTAAVHAVTELGEPRVMYGLLATAGVMRSLGTSRPEAVLVRPLLVFGTGAVVRRALCEALRRPRPPEAHWLITPDGHSFPSRHTTAAGLGLAALALSLPEGRARGLALAGAGAAAAVVGAGRVYQGVHWTSDVVAGWLFAVGWAALAGSASVPAQPLSRQDGVGARA